MCLCEYVGVWQEESLNSRIHSLKQTLSLKSELSDPASSGVCFPVNWDNKWGSKTSSFFVGSGNLISDSCVRVCVAIT